MRCNTCGRSLVGLRADHPLTCYIQAGGLLPYTPQSTDVAVSRRPESLAVESGRVAPDVLSRAA